MKITRMLLMLFVLSGYLLAGTPNVEPGTPEYAAMASGSSTAATIVFNPNEDIHFPKNTPIVIYTPGGEQQAIEQAMQYFGMTNYIVRTSTNGVTASDLNWCSILIVGWNLTGSMAGLESNIIENGITGRVILSGHDADYHTVNTLSDTPGAAFFFAQSMEYVLEGGGVGMLALGDSVDGFSSWLPESWGVETTVVSGGEDVSNFTTDGLETGIFDGLEPDHMSDWRQSYHVSFDNWGNGFKAYELGNDDTEVVTIGTPFNVRGFKFTKEDDVDDGSCVTPIEGTGSDTDIVYSICWKNITGHTLTDVRIVDTLPAGVDYPAGWDSVDVVDGELVTTPGDPLYSQLDHTYTWELGTVEAVTEDPNSIDEDWSCVTLEVVVNENAIPGMMLHNEAVIMGTYCVETPDPNDPNTMITTCYEKEFAIATEDTPVCCWDDSSVIYVSENATGANTGLSWTDAYNTEYGLKMALDRAMDSTCGGPFTIYVAQGTYLPGTDVSEYFDLPDDIEVYGGFPTKGCDFADRNPKMYESILSGNISAYDSSFTVVEMGLDSTLDGVTISDGYDYNVHGYQFTVKNCIIENAVNYGIYAEDGNATIKSCMIRNNGADGVYHESIAGNLDVSNSWVMRNSQHGIYSLYTTPKIVSSIVSESDLSNEGRAGVYIENPASTPILHNVTIANNKSLGLQFTDLAVIEDPNDPNSFTMDYPDLDSCIIYFNNKDENESYGSQLSGVAVNSVASYCCIQGCDTGVNNNISAVPDFAYEVNSAGEPDPENYHISAASICKNAGNPNLVYTDQTDYDNESRIADDGVRIVDIGADEVYSCSGDYTEEDISNPLDTNADGVINMIEFQPIASSWLSLDPNDPRWDSDPNWADPDDTINWDGKANLDDTGDSLHIIDLADLELFCENWLWKACWYDAVNSVETTTASTESMTQLSTNTTGIASFARTTSTLMLTEDTTVEERNLYDTLSNAELAQVVIDFRYLQDNVLEMLEECPVDSEDEQNLLDLLVFFDDELVRIKESLQ